MQIAKNIALQLLRGYKSTISPVLPTACRYVPTCSEYAMEAVDRYGAVRGSWMSLRRVLRCHPFAGSGFDPVPVHEQDSFHQCGACAPDLTR
jgi:uncharacterized protein